MQTGRAEDHVRLAKVVPGVIAACLLCLSAPPAAAYLHGSFADPVMGGSDDTVACGSSIELSATL
jgi:hypothetical protein